MCNSFTQTQSTQGRTMKKLLVISAITATALFANPVTDIATKTVNAATDAAVDATKTAVVKKATEAIAPDANKTEKKAEAQAKEKAPEAIKAEEKK